MSVVRDEADAKRVEAQLQAEARQWEKDLRDVMSTPQGRRVLWEILDFTAPMSCAFTGNSGSFFLEGKKSVGQWLFRHIDETCFDLYVIARQEHINRQLRHKVEEESNGS